MLTLVKKIVSTLTHEQDIHFGPDVSQRFSHGYLCLQERRPKYKDTSPFLELKKPDSIESVFYLYVTNVNVTYKT